MTDNTEIPAANVSATTTPKPEDIPLPQTPLTSTPNDSQSTMPPSHSHSLTTIPPPQSPTDHLPPTSPIASDRNSPTSAEDASGAPKWVKDFMDAAGAGMSELRKEVKNIIETGKGGELERLLTDMQEKAPKELGKDIGDMVKAVKNWIENPDELEEGGRWWAVWCPTVLMEVWTLVYAPVMTAWDWLCPATQIAPAAGFSGTATASTMGKTTTYTRVW